jgi:DNA-directed RNA polymerase subunit RPC12/RpoP
MSQDSSTTTTPTKTTVVRPGALIDGGKFVCDHSSHKHYETADPQEWDNHRNDGKHTVSGGTTCVICGKNAVPLDHSSADMKAVCDSCMSRLVSVGKVPPPPQQQPAAGGTGTGIGGGAAK